ncbi:condensation domain-containing protein [Nocardia sp. alder85J]|uniref:condensation domain-containing protein n=1 Tax=Nocardia sp. alder85J TaxID=2862949 RepID=UPI001CD6C75C|nr:condensation domain-containing protein [Nocardia sp. alder85J]MCX4096803.1 condensation domain-containing protein [Nocardia sp. alder85J]
MVDFGLIDEWEPAPGRLTSWVASPESVARARSAPVHPAPPSHQQEQYLRLAAQHAAAEFRYSGLCLVTAEIPAGDLDRAAMTRAVNAFLLRHDTFRTWFRLAAGGAIERHLVPEADVDFVPVEYGWVDDPPTVRDHVQKTTPGPFDWDCFTFGVIEREESTTLYLAVDHLHTDGFGQYLSGFDLALLYAREVWDQTPDVLTPAAGYLDYCTAERAYTGQMSLNSAGVRKWLELIRGNGGSLPSFPLDLGRRGDIYNRSAHRTVTLFDEDTAARFERRCRANGAEFVGGVFAAAALAEHELADSDYYFGMTPVTTRSTAEQRASVGWYVTLLPVAFPLGLRTSFDRVVTRAQHAYENGLRLTATSLQRVVELLPADSDLDLSPGWACPMISYVDARELLGNEFFDTASCGLYTNRAASEQVLIWINRLAARTTLSVIYPDTPVAHDSVERYVARLAAVFAAAAGEEDR